MEENNNSQQKPNEQMPNEQMPIGQMPIEQMFIGHLPMMQMPVGQMPFGQMPIGQMPFGQMPIGQMPVGQMPAYPVIQQFYAGPNEHEIRREQEEKLRYQVSDQQIQEITKHEYNDDEPLSHDLMIQATKATGNASFSDIDAAIKLSLYLKKKTIHSSSLNAQSFPLLASLTVDYLKTAKRAPIDLVCVIDHSGSMYGDRIKLVKESFAYLLKFLGDLDRLSIVIFDDNASRLVPLLRTTDQNKGKILDALKDVKEAGGTDINLGMMHAFHILKQRRYVNPVTSIFLLSDGVDKYAHSRLNMSIEKFGMSDDFTINTFGFTRFHDSAFMTYLAGLRDGNFYFINQIDTVNEAFVDCLGGLLSAVAQNVRIAIKPEQSNTLQGVEIRKTYGDDDMWEKNDKTYITKFGTLVSGKEKGFVLELQIPINKKELEQNYDKNVKVATAEAEIITLDNQVITKKADLYITLLRETEELKEEQEDDREVMKHYYRVKCASLLREARYRADGKAYEGAKKILEGLKEELENSALRTDKFIENLIKDIYQAIKDVSPETYGTVGRHNMMMNERAQMQQRSNLASENNYQNNMQQAMLSEVRSMKNKQ